MRRWEGKVYGPYTGRYFSSRRQTDIEHIVARSEGHDSGLCRAGPDKKKAFARDLLNLTLAAPEVNRCGRNGKCHYGAAEWLPPLNRCWFARRVLDVRRKFRLTVDRREAAALEQVFSNCDSTNMVFAREGAARARPPRVKRYLPRTHFHVGTTTGTGGLLARRRVGMESPRSAAVTRRTPSCATEMVTGLFANERAELRKPSVAMSAQS